VGRSGERERGRVGERGRRGGETHTIQMTIIANKDLEVVILRSLYSIKLERLCVYLL
jgi:hypothetical protein